MIMPYFHSTVKTVKKKMGIAGKNRGKKHMRVSYKGLHLGKNGNTRGKR